MEDNEKITMGGKVFAPMMEDMHKVMRRLLKNMREILFRGKRIDNGEWVEGNYIHRTKYYGDSDDAHFILTGGEFDCDYYDAFKVDPSTVGQYTGLTDKNGKKIFEGDIVKQFDNSDLGYDVGTIEWDKNGCRYRRTTDTAKYTNYCGVVNARIYEVIGNIHDNAELIGGAR